MVKSTAHSDFQALFEAIELGRYLAVVQQSMEFSRFESHQTPAISIATLKPQMPSQTQG